MTSHALASAMVQDYKAITFYLLMIIPTLWKRFLPPTLENAISGELLIYYRLSEQMTHYMLSTEQSLKYDASLGVHIKAITKGLLKLKGNVYYEHISSVSPEHSLLFTLHR